MDKISEALWNDSPFIPSYVIHRTLAGGVAETITPPAGARFCIFSGNSGLGDFYVRVGGTATVPSGDSSDGTSSFCNPGYCKVRPLEDISVISSNAGILTVAFTDSPNARG